MKKILLSVAVLLTSSTLLAQSWVAQNTGFDTQFRRLNSIKIVDASTVWGLAADGAPATQPPAPVVAIQEFTRTTNGGTTWTPGLINIGNPGWNINNISPINGTTAWVSALDISGGPSTPTPGGIWKTTDAGITWVQQNSAAFIGSGAFVNGVHFWNALEGFAFGDPVVGSKIECYKTADGGATWNSITTVPTMLTGEYNYNNGNVFVGDAIWLPTNKGKVLRSLDRGVTWTKLSSPLTDFGSAAVNGSLHFSSATNGVLLGTSDTGANYKLYSTTNGGITWVTPAANYVVGYNGLLSYVPGTSTLVGNGVIPGSPAVPGSSYSMNNGLTFTTIDTGIQRGIVSMLNGSTGWASGFTESSTVGGVYKFSGNLANDTFNENNQMTVSPNPTSGLMNISAKANVNQVVVFDLLGKQVFESKFAGVNNATVDVSSLQSGAYVMKIISDNGSQSVKVLKN